MRSPSPNTETPQAASTHQVASPTRSLRAQQSTTIPPHEKRVFFFPSSFWIVPGLYTSHAGDPSSDARGDARPTSLSPGVDPPAPGVDPGELRLKLPKAFFCGEGVPGVPGDTLRGWEGGQGARGVRQAQELGCWHM